MDTKFLDTNPAPEFWKSRLSDITEAAQNAKRAQVSTFAVSAGKREIPIFAYGEKPDFKRTANYNSACGAKDPSYYAHKENTLPVVFIVGAVHGCELEGIASMMNLIEIAETGRDLLGNPQTELYDLTKQVRLLLVPCGNPDGRARYPYVCSLGLTPPDAGLYTMGNDKNGNIYQWPYCKGYHPMTAYSKVLGAYYNDDGVNIMHDNFFGDMAAETKAILDTAGDEAADYTILLHSGGDIPTFIQQPWYVHQSCNDRIHTLDLAIEAESIARGLNHEVQAVNGNAAQPVPPSFNLTAAIHHVCGGVGILYETYSGSRQDPQRFNAEQVLEMHNVLFTQTLKQAVAEKR